MTPALRCVVASVIVGSFLLGRSADAQGVVAEKGTLTATLAHNYGFADSIVETGGLTLSDVFVDVQNTALTVEYVPIEKLSISAMIPVVGTKYDMAKSGALYDPHGPYDDGSYHFTLEDLRLDARYMIKNVPFAIAANLGITAPMADYAVQGSAATGRHLFGVRLGVGASFYPTSLERLFVDVGYELQLFQKFDETPDTEKYGQTRSQLNFNGGYFILDKLAAVVLGGFRMNHDGIDLKDYNMLTMDEQTWHDPIMKEMGLLLGAGVVYVINDKLFVSGTYSHFIVGRNTLTTNWAALSVGWTIL